MKINIVCGDITSFDGDIIVNAANPVMLGGGGVDGAIHRAAGPGLLAACRSVPPAITAKSAGAVPDAHRVMPLGDGIIRCPVGRVVPTPAFDLRAKWVFHTAAPIKDLKRSGDLRPGETENGDMVEMCRQMVGIFNRLGALAMAMDLTSIAIPALGCGIYGWTHEEVSQVALTWAAERHHLPLEVTFYLFPADSYPVWVGEAKKLGIEGF